MGTNNQPFEFHQRPLHSAKGLIGMPVYFFQDKTRQGGSALTGTRQRLYVDIFRLQASILLSNARYSADQFSTGWSHLTHCLTIL